MGIATTQNGAVQGAPAWFAIAIVFRRIRMGGSGPVVFVACGPSGPRCFCGVWAVRAPLFLWCVGPFMGPSWRLGSRPLRGLLALHRSLGFRNVCAFRGVFVLLKTHPRLQRCDSATLRRKSLRSLTASRIVQLLDGRSELL